MTDPVVEQPKGETPEEPVKPQAQAAPVEPTEKPAAEPEEFDKERAMATIKAQRASEKLLKEQLKDYETLKAADEKRKEADMSETERLTKQANELKEKNDKLSADILRLNVISKTGLPPALADRLKGSTEEELLADAEELKKLLPQQTKAPHVPPTNPANADPNETEQQKRERLFGKQNNVFDVVNILDKGGGVVWNTKE